MDVLVSSETSYGTVEREVPFIPNAVVVFSEDISAELWKFILDETKKPKGKQSPGIGEKMLQALVKDWNFFYEDKKGQKVKVPISDDGVKSYLSKRTQDWITEECTKFFFKGSTGSK